MKLSTNTRYAIRILLELTEATEPIAIATIAERTGISLRTVENIHAVMKQYEITTSTIGAKGGIQLKGSLAEISLGEIVLLFDDGVEFSVCCGDKSNDCPNQGFCTIRTMWDNISRAIQETLNDISLEAVLKSYPREKPKVHVRLP